MRWYISLFLSTLSCAGKISFSSTQALIDQLENPSAIGVTDVDQDGDIDFVAAEMYGPQLQWWGNDGEGNFKPEGEFFWDVSTDSKVLHLGDYNDDSVMDTLLVITNDQPFSQTLAVSYGKNNFEFESPKTFFDVTHSGSPRIQDLNGDHIPDLIFERSYIFLSSGVFTYGPQLNVSLSFDHFAPWTFLDLNQDGIKDLVQISGVAAIYHPLTAEGFGNPITIKQGSTLEKMLAVSMHPVSHDVLILSAEKEARASSTLTGKVFLRSHTYEENFQLSEKEELEWQTNDLQTAHFLTYPGAMRQFVMTPLGDRGLASISEVLYKDGSLQVNHILTEYLDNQTHPLLGRIDGDSEDDFILPCFPNGDLAPKNSSQVKWTKIKQSVHFPRVSTPVTDTSLRHKVQYIGDIDGDGDEDFITIQEFLSSEPFGDTQIFDVVTSPLIFWDNQGTAGEFLRNELPLFDIGTSRLGHRFEIVAAKDLHGTLDAFNGTSLAEKNWPRGRIDFLIAIYTYHGDSSCLVTLQWMFQDEDGVFHLDPDFLYLDWWQTTARWKWALGDWDGDGTDDLMITRQSSDGKFIQRGWTYWAKGNGMRFGQSQFLTIGFVSPFIEDFDRDGNLDLIGNTALFNGDNTGGTIGTVAFSDKASLQRYEPTGFYFDLEQSFDLNQDNIADFFGINSGEWGVFQRDETGSIQKLSSVPTPEAFHPLVQHRFLDLDSDGDEDLLEFHIEKFSFSEIAVFWRENRRGSSSSFWGQELIPLAPAITSGRNRGHMIDIDNDGIKDLMVEGIDGSRLEWFKITKSSEPMAFTTWMDTYEARGHSADLSSDYDLDGFSNWEEFIFGSNPALRENDSTSVPGVRMGENGLEFSFLSRIDADEMGRRLYHERSSDLEKWSTITESPLRTPENENYERVSFPLNSELKREFFKTTISPPPNE
ncbi:MAG: FG-GAP repeat domain-containing protein [Akkermansiaceae bacterium]